MSNELQNIQAKKYVENILRISELENCIKETVIGQDKVVSSIATTFYNSIYLDLKCCDLIIGPSGSGKTLTMKQFCKEMGLVYTIENATQYTEDGYVGDSVDLMLTNLFLKTDGDLQAAENGILVIDEIGKKASSGETTRDVSGKGVQQALLPILAGGTINMGLGSKFQRVTMPFDTSNLKIFLMDAFVGLDEIKEKRLKKARNETLGFSINTSKEEEELSPEKSPYTKQDLIEYGLIPEIVGRINKIHVMNPITMETKINILKNSKESRFRQYEAGFNKLGIQLKYKAPDIFEEIAKATGDYQTGARELANTVNYLFDNLCHQIFNSEEKISEIWLIPGIANDNTKYILK